MKWRTPSINTKTPITANTAAHTARTIRNGSFVAATSPSSTAGTLAIIMPSVVPATTAASCGYFAGERHGRDLRLVAHFQQEEREQRGHEHAEARRLRLLLVFELVGNEHPHRHRQERHAEDPAHHLRIDGVREPGAHTARERVIQQRGNENPEHDRHGLAIAGGENEREQLRLVADLGERHDTR